VPSLQAQAITVEIWRPPAPSGGKIGTPLDTGATLRILVEAHGRLDPIVADQSGRMFYNLSAYTLPGTLPLPDVREQDQLRDANEIDAHTQAPAIYIVRGVWRYPLSHLELFVQRQVGA
jgi:hypothetical protein